MEGGEQVPQGGEDGRAKEAGKRQRAVGAHDMQGPQRPLGLSQWTPRCPGAGGGGPPPTRDHWHLVADV